MRQKFVNLFAHYCDKYDYHSVLGGEGRRSNDLHEFGHNSQHARE
jgi:hypothetical protein